MNSSDVPSVMYFFLGGTRGMESECTQFNLQYKLTLFTSDLYSYGAEQPCVRHGYSFPLPLMLGAFSNIYKDRSGASELSHVVQ